MRDDELSFDREHHVLYSKECRQVILKYIAKHFPQDEAENVFDKIQQQYASYLESWRTDLGGKANSHNGMAGTYDCIAVFCYYEVCKEVTSFEEIEALYGELFLPAFEKLSFANANKPLIRRLLHLAFALSAKQCKKWNDYRMEVEPLKKGEPIRYRFTACPVAEFAKEYGFTDILPALCNADYAAMECMHARLIRTQTLGFGAECDYTICGDRDDYLKAHAEYRDAQGYRRNH